MSDLEIYTPLSEYLPMNLWPEDIFIPGQSDFLDSIAYVDGDLLGDDESLTAYVALRAVTELTFDLLAGFVFVVGEGPIEASLYADRDGFSVQIDTNVLKLRLPRTVFIPVIEQESNLIPDPDPTHFVEIKIPVGLGVSQEFESKEFDIDFDWPGEEAGNLRLPNCLLGETGIVVAADFLLRLSLDQPLPDKAIEYGLDEDWRGIFISEATIRPLNGSDEIVVDIPGINDISLVIDPVGFQAAVSLDEFDFSVGFTARLHARFQPTLLLPMRKIQSTDGVIDFEPNPNRRYVEVDLGQVNLAINSSGKIVFNTNLQISLSESIKIVAADLIIESAHLFLDLSGEEKCLAFKWTEPNLRDWLRRLSPALNEQGSPVQSEMALRVILGDSIREIRLDWTYQQGSERSFALPGLSIGVPATPTFTLLLGGQEEDANRNTQTRNLSHVAFILTLKQNDQISVRSTFAWGRSEGQESQRELQNKEAKEDDKPLFEAIFTVKDTVKSISLVLLQFDLLEFKLPKLFRQLKNPLPTLDFNDTQTLCTPTELEMQSLQGTDWTGKLTLGDVFELPFLKEKNNDPSNNQFGQFIKLDISKFAKVIDLNFVDKTVDLPVGVTVKIGSLQFKTNVDFKFNWETFSLDVDHDQGIDLISEQTEFAPEEEHLGLKWRCIGKPLDDHPFLKEDDQGDATVVPQYHYFTLVTKNYDYQIQQAEGAKFEVFYTSASAEPIIFAVTDFRLTPKGISLVAEVTDQPARLNGIDTRFRFHGSRLEIVENRIKDFTLAGSGPLPPALVGEAMADIWLQFSQRQGNLTLVAGSAQLKGNKLLHCQGTRFQFSVDALGLKFVNDGKFHLYFTLTGSAQFVLASGDDREGALALLPNIKVDMVECPLTSDISVIGKHVKFLIELPSPKSFNFLGCFEMELRGFGFIPQAKEFGGDGAMELTGQLKFAQGLGDTPDSRVDYHRLLVGLPEKGQVVPRIYFKNLPVNLNFGAAFKLSGVVEFKDDETEKGFLGEGVIQIQGLPTMAAAFDFLRVRRDSASVWLRAWFIALEVRRVSFLIPVVQIYLREVGLGFGYRFTLVSIKTADRANDVRQLLAELKKLSRTQGDSSRRDRWEVDLEEQGEDPRWTIVLRALLAQSSAAPSPLDWKDEAEKTLPCLYLFDAVIAFRSDLTFFMAVRGWINTNYYSYDRNTDGLKTKPLVSGFVLLSPRQKRFLAHLASNPEGYVGDTPPLPDLVKEAIKGVQFSATLLIEPGLLHFELGWPNMLRWNLTFGPLKIENRGGFIFRVTETEFVIGISYLARGSLKIEAGVDLKIVGVRVSASAELAFGARLIAVIKFKPSSFWIYGGLGLELRIQISIEFWIRIPLIFTSIKLSFKLSVGLGLTAGLEVGLASAGFGLRGRGTISLSAMGHQLQFGVSFALGEGTVERALAETEKFLNLGLEATEVEKLPGLNGAELTAGKAGPEIGLARAALPRAVEIEEVMDQFHMPGYSIFVIREPGPDGWSYFVLLPQGEAQATEPSKLQPEPGFLPAPPHNYQLKLLFWGSLLDRGEFPLELRNEFKDHGEPLPKKFQLSVEPPGKQWLILDQTNETRRRYRIADNGQSLTAEKIEEWQKQFDFDTTDIKLTNPNAIPPVFDGYPLSQRVFLLRLRAVPPGGPFYRYLKFIRRIYPNIDEDFKKTLQKIFSIQEQQISDEFDSNHSIKYEAGEWTITDQGQQFKLQLSGYTLTIWKRLPTERIIFGNLERDRQSYELNRGQIPQEIKDEFNDDSKVVPAETNVDTWYITESAPPPNRYKVQLNRLEQYLKIILEIEEDFTLHLPAIALFFVGLEYTEQLDQGLAPISLLGEFENHGILLANPQVSVTDPGYEWRITEATTSTVESTDLAYVIRKELVSGTEKLNIYGGFSLEQFDPLANQAQGGWLNHTQKVNRGEGTSWKVNWEAIIFSEKEVGQYQVPSAQSVEGANEKLKNSKPQPATVNLANYLKYAFNLREIASDGEATGQVIPSGDPNPELMRLNDRPLEDERVHNPTDDSFEAAVRGAVEQFEGSPFFKLDTRYTYDRALDEAFKQDTTIYHANGQLPNDLHELQKVQYLEQAMQLRGMVIHDLITDVQDYARSWLQKPTGQSIPFQMGLVFRFKGRRPPWLDEVVADEKGQKPFIQQRLGPKVSAPAEIEKPVSTFNIIQTNFSKNPPQFQRVQQFTDANTIALTWDLVWPTRPASGCTPGQAEPEHHLAHYQVQRRALDGSERDVIYTVKSAQVLHRETQSNGTNQAQTVLNRLKARFQVVDHFTHETLSDVANLPATGRSYLYTITPIDFEGNVGRPLTLIATRKPNIPPLVPVDAELVVRYRLKAEQLLPEKAAAPVAPRAAAPNRVHVEWTEPRGSRQDPQVPVAQYRLIFRKEATLPIGSYGLDSTTQRSRVKSLPTSNARPLPTDLKLELEIEATAADTARRLAKIPIETLRRAGILPDDASDWRPESWRVFIQTISVNNVPSALAPVQLLLRVELELDDLDDDELQDRREERRPAELEWLAYPLKFPLLPPEDQLATPGLAHVPMPPTGLLGETSQFKFSGSISQVAFQQHPAGLRCLRFRWNQGPSQALNYPLDLNAGYEILQLDIDAHTTETFEQPERLAEALRTIQEVQMLPAEDLWLAPSDTLTTNQWEAWYPSAVLRRRPLESQVVQGSEITVGPWYTWRESFLEWPDEGNFIVNGERTKPLHPALQALLDQLKTAYTVDLQISPPIQPNTFAKFMTSTASEADPYGWGILQRFGLAVTFSLHHKNSGQLITQGELLAALNEALEALNEATTSQLRHLFVEVLFQPGRSMELQPGSVDPESLLGMVQVSLRPIPRQYLRYSQMKIVGPTQKRLDIFIDLKEKPASYINQADPASNQTELTPPASQKPVQRWITLPLTGQTTLLFRSETTPQVEVSVALSTDPKNMAGLDPFKSAVTYIGNEQPNRLIFHPEYNRLSRDDRHEICRALFGLDDASTGNNIHAETKATCELLLALNFEPLTPFAVTDELSTYFVVPDNLADVFVDATTEPGRQWQRFRRYAETLNSDEPGVEQILVPTEKTTLQPILPDFLNWSQRFFDATGAPTLEPSTMVATMAAGPWLATAYPRAGSPAYATPDANGRLKYDHLFADKWAHTYRYYIRPYGRYDLLWQSFRQSPSLFPSGQGTQTKLPLALPDPAQGGLDVVIERTHPVEKPLLLSSRRLDPPTVPGQPTPPGSTWEVIIAQHAEQSLIERNQTLARQLAFRGIAFTLLRRFTYADWIEQLEALSQTKFQIKFVTNHLPPLPEASSLTLDHLDLDQTTLPVAVEQSLALPERLSNFQQGALALQWEALPFYYTHRLLVIAQTASNVSPINEVIQRDFEYRSPAAAGMFEAMDQALPNPAQTIRLRRAEIPLRAFWESLPELAQQYWSSERPDPRGSTEPKRKFSSLPDPEVVYQIVEIFGGNIEVQVELYFDQGNKSYTLRQLGQNFIGESESVQVSSPQTPQGDFVLSVGLRQATREKLSQNYTIPEKRTPKLQMANGFLVVSGVFSREDYDALKALGLSDQDAQVIDSLYQSWSSQEPVSEARDLTGLPIVLQKLVDFVAASETLLRWEGPLSAVEQQALLALPGDQAFREALARLAVASNHADENGIKIETAPLDPAHAAVKLPDQAKLTLDPTTHTYTALSWTGLLFDEQKERDIVPALTKWAQIRELVEAVGLLLNKLEEWTIVKPLTPPRPLPEELAEMTRQRLLFDNTTLSWTSPAPTDTERASLNTLLGDTNLGDEKFKAALTALLAAIDAAHTIAIPPNTAAPKPEELPEAIRNRLQIKVDANQLVWPGPAPTDTERAALSQVIGTATFPPKFVEGVKNLVAALDQQKSVPLEPVADRPRQADLPESLRDQLTIESTKLQWRGRVHTQVQFDQLQALSTGGDPAFNQAVQTIITELQTQPIEVSLNIPTRPQSKDLPDVLKDKLLISYATMRYHGLMKIDEGQALLNLFEPGPDQRAIHKLYTASLSKGLRNRELKLRTRRGNAAPSPLESFSTKPLPS